MTKYGYHIYQAISYKGPSQDAKRGTMCPYKQVNRQVNRQTDRRTDMNRQTDEQSNKQI